MPDGPQPDLFIPRRRVLAWGLAAFAALYLGRPAEAAPARQESPLPSPGELIQQPDALRTCMRLYLEGRLNSVPPIGWIDSMPVAASHRAFRRVIDAEKSKSYVKGVSPIVTENNTHGTWALQFATQDKTGGQPGLSQEAWSRVIFTHLFNAGDYGGSDPLSDVNNYVAALRYLTDQGVGVIGTIPTWTDSSFTKADRPGVYQSIRDGFNYAREKNVIIVLPAGNANVDMSVVSDKRTLHEIAREFDNVVVVGGVDRYVRRAQWDNGRGSNTGKGGYIDLVSVATDRIIPWGTTDQFAHLNGTTFCVGDAVSALSVIQGLTRLPDGKLLPPDQVLMRITETAQPLWDSAQFGSGLLQTNNAITTAARQVKR